MAPLGPWLNDGWLGLVPELAGGSDPGPKGEQLHPLIQATVVLKKLVREASKKVIFLVVRPLRPLSPFFAAYCTGNVHTSIPLKPQSVIPVLMYTVSYRYEPLATLILKYGRCFKTAPSPSKLLLGTNRPEKHGRAFLVPCNQVTCPM